MNEQLRQLMLEAGYAAPELAGRANKFAELIVKECMDIASEVRGDEPATDTHYVIGYDRACEKMIDGIKEHFGVEE